MVELSLADRGRPGRVACGGGTDFGSISAHVHGTVECKSGNGPRHELTCVTHVSRSRVMPLVKLFTRPGLSKAVPLAPLQTRLCEIWKTTPFISLLLLAGLVQVPEDMQEAAKVDGATAWQRLWKVTLPNMKAAGCPFPCTFSILRASFILWKVENL